MWGPAGVGKSAIAKSCAEKTAEEGRLGASFFFSRTQHVDDPKWFFTTIAHQLVQKVDEYRQVLGSRIQHNQDLHTKGLDVQFRELIIAPFPELAERNMGVQDKTVIIDGLDECNRDPAQSKIMELVAKSVIEHGDKIPLLWAFFSRPESHIAHEFSSYSSSHFSPRSSCPCQRAMMATSGATFVTSSVLLPMSTPCGFWKIPFTSSFRWQQGSGCMPQPLSDSSWLITNYFQFDLNRLHVLICPV